MWSKFSQNSPSHTTGSHTDNHAVTSTVSEVEHHKKDATAVITSANKRVSFEDDESKLMDEKLEELKGLIMAEHNIDITPILMKIDGAEEAVLVTADDDEAQ